MSQLPSIIKTELEKQYLPSLSLDERDQLLQDLLTLGDYTNNKVMRFLPFKDFKRPLTAQLVYRVLSETASSLPTYCYCTTNYNLALKLAVKKNKWDEIESALVPIEQIVLSINRHKGYDLIIATSASLKWTPIPYYPLATVQSLLTATEKNIADSLSHRLEQEWFIHPSNMHGISHTERVLTLALLINHLEKLDTPYVLGHASLIHDIGRIHDCTDFDHGDNAISRSTTLSLQFPELTADDLSIVQFIVRNHCIDDASIIPSSSPRVNELLWAFKDADNLDRVRVYDLNPQFLRTKAAQQLTYFAQYQYLISNNNLH